VESDSVVSNDKLGSYLYVFYVGLHTAHNTIFMLSRTIKVSQTIPLTIFFFFNLCFISSRLLFRKSVSFYLRC
jgi:hypothetical protein